MTSVPPRSDVASPSELTDTSMRLPGLAKGGSVYLAVQPTAATPARLLRSDDNGVVWTDVADATYRATALLPYRLVVDGSGAVWVCLAGNGVLRGVPAP